VKQILLTIVILILSGCADSISEVRDVYTKSGYVGKSYTTKKAALYIKNLPRKKNVPKVVAWNTSTLLHDKATLHIGPLIDNGRFFNFKPRFFIRPSYLEYIPGKTTFKVVGEYRAYRNRFPLGNSNIHIILLKNSNNQVIEISKYAFEDLFITKWTKEQIYLLPKILSIKRDLYYLKKYGNLRIVFCPKNSSTKSNYTHFIEKYSLENEISISNGDNYCKEGFIVNFTSPRSYLTTVYNLFSWNISANLYTISGTYLHNNHNKKVTWEFGFMLAGLQYEDYEIFSTMD